ncbi:hypothetical protein ABZP36_008976 [Zizania latifolia]
MDFKVALFLLVSSFLYDIIVPADSGCWGFPAALVRTEKTINFTRAARQSLDRLSTVVARLDLNVAATGFQTLLRWEKGGGSYTMEFAIGTPP